MKKIIEKIGKFHTKRQKPFKKEVQQDKSDDKDKKIKISRAKKDHLQGAKK